MTKKLLSLILLISLIGGNITFAANGDQCRALSSGALVTERRYTCEFPPPAQAPCGPASTPGGRRTPGGAQTCLPDKMDCVGGTRCCICDRPPDIVTTPVITGTVTTPVITGTVTTPVITGTACSSTGTCIAPAVCDPITSTCTTTPSPGGTQGGNQGGGITGGANDCAGCYLLPCGPSDIEKTCNSERFCCPRPQLPDDQTVYGMTIGPKCLLNGQCKFNIYDALGIRGSVRNAGTDGQPGDPTSIGLFVQDIVLSATMFIGTIVTIAIIVSGLMRIMAGATGADPTKAKDGLINAVIGLLIVVSSYLIIRLVQYIAKGF